MAKRRGKKRSKKTKKSKLNQCFEIVPIEGKGLGLRATRDINMGEMILEEKPIMMNVNRANADELFNSLSKKDKERALSLSNHYKGNERSNYQSYYDSDYDSNEYNSSDSDEEQSANKRNIVVEESQIKGILRTNAMAMGYDSSLACLCEISSRINHACDCNSRYIWCEDNSMQRVYSIRKISKGEEITVSYCLKLQNSFQRQFFLEDKFGFTCTCDLCKTAPLSDIFVERIKFMSIAISDMMDISPPYAMEGTKKLLYYINDFPFYRTLIEEILYRAAIISAKSGDIDNALYLVSEYLRYSILFGGIGTFHSKRAASLLRDPSPIIFIALVEGSLYSVKLERLDIKSILGF